MLLCNQAVEPQTPSRVPVTMVFQAESKEHATKKENVKNDITFEKCLLWFKKIKLTILSYFYNRENTNTFQDSSHLQRGKEGEGMGGKDKVGGWGGD